MNAVFKLIKSIFNNGHDQKETALSTANTPETTKSKDTEAPSSPILEAIKSGDISFLKNLSKSELDTFASDGATVLHLACHYGQLEITKWLLDIGFNPNVVNPVTHQTPLHNTILKANIDVIKALLEAKADLNRPDKDLASPLIVAAMFGRDKALELLLSAGADKNQRDDGGKTAFHFAVSLRRHSCISSLLCHNVDISIKDLSGINALLYATRNGLFEVVDELVKRGAKLTDLDPKGRNILLVGNRHIHRDFIKKAVNAGCDINQQDDNGWTALHYAFFSDNDSVAQDLIDEGIDIVLKNKDGNRGHDLHNPSNVQLVNKKIEHFYLAIISSTTDKLPFSDAYNLQKAYSGHKNPMTLVGDPVPQELEDETHFSSIQRLELIRSVAQKYLTKPYP